MNRKIEPIWISLAENWAGALASSGLGGRWSRRRLIRKADRLRNIEAWLGAAQAYNLALKCKGNRAALWVQLGHVQKEGGDFVSAVKSYQTALTLIPDDPDCWTHYGHLCRRIGLYEKADQAAVRLRELIGGEEDAAEEQHRTSSDRSPARFFRPAHIPFYCTDHKSGRRWSITESRNVTPDALEAGEVRLLNQSGSRDLRGFDKQALVPLRGWSEPGSLQQTSVELHISISTENWTVGHLHVLVRNPHQEKRLSFECIAKLASDESARSVVNIFSVKPGSAKWIAFSIGKLMETRPGIQELRLAFETNNDENNPFELTAICFTGSDSSADLQWKEVKEKIRNYEFPSIMQYEHVIHYERLRKQFQESI